MSQEYVMSCFDCLCCAPKVTNSAVNAATAHNAVATVTKVSLPPSIESSIPSQPSLSQPEADSKKLSQVKAVYYQNPASEEEGRTYSNLISKFVKNPFNKEDSFVVVFDQKLTILIVSKTNFLDQIKHKPEDLIGKTIEILFSRNVTENIIAMHSASEKLDQVWENTSIGNLHDVKDLKSYSAHIFVHFSKYNVAFLSKADCNPIANFRIKSREILTALDDMPIIISRQKPQTKVVYTAEEFPMSGSDFHTALGELENLAIHSESVLHLLCTGTMKIVASSANLEELIGFNYKEVGSKNINEIITIGDRSFLNAFVIKKTGAFPAREGGKTQRVTNVVLEPFGKEKDLFAEPTIQEWAGTLIVKNNPGITHLPSTVPPSHLNVKVTVNQINRSYFIVMINLTEAAVRNPSISLPSNSFRGSRSSFPPPSPSSSLIAASPLAGRSTARQPSPRYSPTCGRVLEEGRRVEPVTLGDGATVASAATPKKTFLYSTPAVSSAHPSQLILLEAMSQPSH